MKMTNNNPVTVQDVQGILTPEELNQIQQLCTEANADSQEKTIRLAFVCHHLNKHMFAYQHTILFSGLMIFRRHAPGQMKMPMLCKVF